MTVNRRGYQSFGDLKFHDLFFLEGENVLFVKVDHSEAYPILSLDNNKLSDCIEGFKPTDLVRKAVIDEITIIY